MGHKDTFLAVEAISKAGCTPAVGNFVTGRRGTHEFLLQRDVQNQNLLKYPISHWNPISDRRILIEVVIVVKVVL